MTDNPPPRPRGSGLPLPADGPRASRAGNGLARGLILATVFGVVVYLGFGAWGGFREVGARLRDYSWATALAAAGLAALNYLLRFVKWEYYLRRLDIAVPRGRSFGIFLSGFALTVTPGKIGEVLKSYLLRESDGVPMARSAPIVVAERVTDLIALMLLALVGVGELGSSRKVLVVGAVFVGALVLGVSSQAVANFSINLVARLPAVGKLAPKLREFHAAARELLRPGPLLIATMISAVAWACECLAFWVVLGGFPGTDAGLVLCTFIYAAMTVAGALSFLPGGLGVQEGGMVALLIAAARGVDKPTAFAATFVTRVCTLWFAVIVGLIALAWVRRTVAPVDLAALQAARAEHGKN